jgi:flagellar basal-body rod protein FlgB
MKLIENNHIKLLANAMDAYSLRQKMTASNVANIDTPGYKKVSVSFEQELQEAEKSRLSMESLDDVNPRIVQTDEQPILENEMMEMADTQMRIQLVTRALRENFEQIKTGITGQSR